MLAGDHDVIRDEHTIEIYHHIPNSQLAIFPNATHLVPFDDPAMFNATVERFLRTPFVKKDRIKDTSSRWRRCGPAKGRSDEAERRTFGKAPSAEAHAIEQGPPPGVVVQAVVVRIRFDEEKALFLRLNLTEQERERLVDVAERGVYSCGVGTVEGR